MHFRVCVAFCAITTLLLAVVQAEDAPVTKNPPAEKDTPESVVRQRFLLAYQTAQTAEARAETVAMLRGMKEKESLRLMAGMLGDRNEVVRRSACAAMARTADLEGYFVKPLMGALADTSTTVRVAASDALSNATLKADAIKALAFALMTLVGQRQADDKSDDAVILIKAYDSALEKLTGQKSKARDPRGLSSFWIDHWKQHEDELRAEDAKKVPADEPATRPANLPRDSFDGK